MDFLRFIMLALVGIGIVALVLGRGRHGGERVRKGTGHALLGLQQFIEPSVEHIFEVENREHVDDDEEEGDGDDAELIKSDVATSLSHARIDPEEVRRHLTAVLRAGLDWEEVYAQCVRDELAARPFKAPAIPPAWRVAPRM